MTQLLGRGTWTPDSGRGNTCGLYFSNVADFLPASTCYFQVTGYSLWDLVPCLFPSPWNPSNCKVRSPALRGVNQPQGQELLLTTPDWRSAQRGDRHQRGQLGAWGLDQQTSVQGPALPLPSFAILVKSVNPSEPQFLPLYNDGKRAYLKEFPMGKMRKNM